MRTLGRRAWLLGAVIGALGAVFPANAQPQNVPRERTLILAARSAGPEFQAVGVANPYMAGEVTNIGPHLVHEPLFFLNTLRDQLIPWLATGYEYGPEFRTLTLRLREGVTWSDGTAFTAEDVAFTLNLLAENGRGRRDLQHAVAVASFVQRAEARGAGEVVIGFSQPAPRFVQEFLAWHFGRGLTMLPAHVFRQVPDPASFTFFDVARGWPLSTGPYRLVRWTSTEVMLDRRDDWWAARTGFARLPHPQRVLSVPFVSNDRSAQLLVANQVDVNRGHPTALVRRVLEQNAAVTTFSGRVAPYGNIDWWPTSLFFNNQAEPFTDVRVRRAMALAINRAQVIAVAHDGASQPTVSPFPAFETLRPAIQATAAAAREARVGDHDLRASAALMEEAGWRRGRDGIWARDGRRLTADMHSIADLGSVGNVVAEQLRRGGFEVTFVAAPDSVARIRDGRAQLILWGHHGSTSDPFATLDSYTCRHARPIGEPTFPFFSRWCNSDYDAIVAELGRTAPSDARALDLVRRAMEIWYRELPEVPIAEWYHQIPLNTTYWRNWPSQENPYAQPAPWLMTGPLLLHHLEPVR